MNHRRKTRLRCVAALWLLASVTAVRAQDAAPGPEVGATEALESVPTIAVDVDNGAAGEALTREPDTVVLEEVVVTAQKTRQTLREVPASVTALSGEFMRDSKVLTPNDVGNYVPNSQIRVSPFAGEIRIRGYGTSISNIGFESSVGLVIDDVYYGRSAFLSSMMYDVDRLEVIRGPQGALFGKNTVAGVINIATVDADRYTAGDITMFARDDLEIRDARGGVSVPLGEGIYSRFAGAVQAFDGLYYNTALDRPEADMDAHSGRVKLRLTDLFGTDAQLRLAASAGSQKANGNLFQLSRASPATMAVFREYDADVEDDAYNDQLSSNVPARVHVLTEALQANVDLPLGEVLGLESLNATSISAYASNEARSRTIDFDFSPAPVVRLDLANPSPYDQYSQELRFAGRGGSLFGLFGRTEFVAGLYYLDSRLISNDLVVVEDLGAAAAFVVAARVESFTDANGVPLGDAASQALARLLALVVQTPLDDALLDRLAANERAELLLDQRQQALSAYGQITTYVTDSIAAILGWRLGRETKDGHLMSTAPEQAVFIPMILGQANHDSYRKRSETESSPKAGLKYDYSKNVSTYAMWARGFKGGGFNALPFNADNLEFEPETANTVELGIKTRLFDGTLDANLALYRTDFEDLQVSVFSGTTFQVLNAAAARSQGVEADFRWLSPFPGTLLRGTLGYSDAYYTEYDNAPAPADATLDDPGIKECQTAPDDGMPDLPSTPSIAPPAYCQDLAGRSLVSAPKWTATLIPQLSLPGFSPGWGFQFALEALFTSERHLDVDLDPRTLQDDTLQFNARISVGSVAGNWSFSVLGTNLTEEGILGQISDQPVAPGNFGAVRLDRGREFFGAIKVNF